MTHFSVDNLAKKQTKTTAKPLILLVEEDKQSLKLTKQLLLDSFEVLSADNALSAIEMVKELPAERWLQVVISDNHLTLPGGENLLPQIQQLNADTLGILLCSDVCPVANGADNNGANGGRGKIFALLNKPLDPQQLLTTTDRALAVYRHRRQLLSEVDDLTMEVQTISEALAEKKLLLNRLLEQIAKLGSNV